MEFKYLKGPVKSRRLGRSLGINLLSDKICSFNCVYCEAGRTKKLTSERNEYVPVDEVIKELEEFLSKSPELDYITFAGTGEPVMNNRINDIILFIKQNYPEYKLALLTNASFFNDENIIDEIKDCDLIIPSLDAASNKVFKKINRPFKAINIDDIINGLIKLRKKFNIFSLKLQEVL